MKKVSKIHILSQAVGYIQCLHELLGSQEQTRVKTEAPGYEYYPQAHNPDYQVPMYQSDNSDMVKVFSDFSLHSPVWTSQQHYSTAPTLSKSSR